MNLAVAFRSRSDNLRGILAMLAAMASLLVNDAALKLAAAGLPAGQAIFLRGLFAALLSVGVAAATVGLGALRQAGGPRVQLRTAADMIGTILYLSALLHMPIADATAILQFTPLAITAGAALFLGARVGWRRWLATGAGLIGVLIIVQPGGAGFNAWSLLALGAVGFVAGRDLLTRRVGAEVPTIVMVVASAAALAAGALALAPFETWVWPSPTAAVLLFLAGVGWLGGNFWVVVAMRTGEIAVVSPFRYSLILWAVIAGLILWGEIPDPLSWLGIAIVTAAGVYTILRENRVAGTAREAARRWPRRP